jgi:hypothetical protein
MPWTPQRETFRTPADINQKGKAPAFLRLGILHATGTIWFDDIKLRELPSKK